MVRQIQELTFGLNSLQHLKQFHRRCIPDIQLVQKQIDSYQSIFCDTNMNFPVLELPNQINVRYYHRYFEIFYIHNNLGSPEWLFLKL